MIEAFEQFKEVVLAEHMREFSSITLQDVYGIARAIESEHAARGTLRNMRRIQQFLDRLDQYGSVARVICEESELLSWVWAPVGWLLQVASECIEALDKLLVAYSQVAVALPQLTMVTATLKQNHSFQQVLAMIYVDLLAFNQRLYGFFSRTGTYLYERSPPLPGILTNLYRRMEDDLLMHLGTM